MGLPCCPQASSSCGEQGKLAVMRRFLTSVVFLAEEHTLYLLMLQQQQLKNSGAWTSVVAAHRLSSCSAHA